MSWFGWGGGSRWTIATLVVFGIIIAIFLPYIVSFLSYGISAMINMTSIISDAMAQVNNESSPQKIVIKSGNYSASVPIVSEPLLKSIEEVILVFLNAAVRVLTDPIIFGMVVGVTLIIIALEMRTS